MFIGHFGLALGAKRAAPSISLGALFIACELADLIWPVLVSAGIERVVVQPGITAFTPLDFVSYPYSHSLVTLCLWGLAFGVAYVAMTRAGVSAAVTLALLVVSHWVLDVATHRPDMPLTPWSGTKLGLGLWNSIPGTLVVESVIFAAGLLLFLRAPSSRRRGIGLWALIAALVVLYLAAAFGPPPPSSEAVAWSANGIWLFVVWAWFIDRAPAGTEAAHGQTRPARR